MGKYVIFSDSCCDMSKELREKLNVQYYKMRVFVDGVEKEASLDWDEYSVKEFYNWLREGRKVKTNQVPPEEFLKESRPWLEQGYDILYVSCSSGLSGSLNTFTSVAVPTLLEEFPDRKMLAIDTLSSSGGEAMLVLQAVALRDAGKSMEEIKAELDSKKLKVNQFCTVQTLTYLQRAGRVTVMKAFMGNLIGKKPILISDKIGQNNVIKTVRGSKNAYAELINGTKEVYNLDEYDTLLVGHGDDYETALKLKETLEKDLGVKNVIIYDIGPIVGTSAGPGVVAIYSYGKEVNI